MIEKTTLCQYWIAPLYPTLSILQPAVNFWPIFLVLSVGRFVNWQTLPLHKCLENGYNKFEVSITAKDWRREVKSGIFSLLRALVDRPMVNCFVISAIQEKSSHNKLYVQTQLDSSRPTTVGTTRPLPSGGAKKPEPLTVVQLGRYASMRIGIIT